MINMNPKRVSPILNGCNVHCFEYVGAAGIEEARPRVVQNSSHSESAVR